VIFHKIKVAKHIWDPCCHLAADAPHYLSQTEHKRTKRHWLTVWQFDLWGFSSFSNQVKKVLSLLFLLQKLGQLKFSFKQFFIGKVGSLLKNEGFLRGRQ
jgi:hypothetical protein